MSLRRSARNVGREKAASGAAEALYEKTGLNGSSKDASKRRGPNGATALEVSQKKAPAARKRKVPSSSEVESSNPTTSLANSTSDLVASKDTAHESLHDVSTEGTNTAKPTSIPNPRGSLSASDINAPSVHLPPPSTPGPAKRPRRTKAPSESPAKPIPFTPTPSGVNFIAKPLKVQDDHVLDSLARLNPTLSRPVSPHATNAPVLTPDHTAVIVNAPSPGESPVKTPARKRKPELPPDVGVESPLKKGSATVDTLLADAEAWLIRVDGEVSGKGRLERLVREKRCAMFSPEGLGEVVDPFTALASGIIGQQVSGAAASSIRAKFTSLFPSTHPSFPTPTQVLTKDLPTLRTAGLSQRKAEYITGLAEKFASGEFTAEGLVRASDEELIEKLVAVRGLGRWSVEMFACFGLKRMDVFSTGDLGVQRGMAAYMGRDVSKLKNKGGKWKYMSEPEMLSIASKFSPYRSLFMWYMWRIADVETEVLE
ncbi:DNA-3-methyladenine glycosylase [Stagonosporopsis vannaccii]|nr:DNA-3-methyladenine glycosylase [Stagonosporopsis vannaccii]